MRSPQEIMSTGPQTWRELMRIARANEGIVYQIVSRCHVGESVSDVGDYAVSRMGPDAADWHKPIVRRLAGMLHRRNRRLHRSVMRGA